LQRDQVLRERGQALDEELADLGVVNESLVREVRGVGVARPVRDPVAEELPVERGGRRRPPAQLDRGRAGVGSMNRFRPEFTDKAYIILVK
jgi:hypothetical protein